jgi:hypothetical protein
MTLTEVLQSSIFSGFVSGILVSVANHLLTRKKTTAEIEKLRAEAELTRAQAKQITDKLSNLSDKVGYKLPDAGHENESVLYTSDDTDRFDFRVEKIDKAEGDLSVKDGILSISRANAVGTLQIWLENYHYPNRAPQKTMPKDESISGDRKLRASCEIKTVGGEHTIVLVIKGEKSAPGVHMAEKRQRITNNEWTPLEAYFRVPPSQSCNFRIDDRDVSAPGSSVQIRRLVLAERTSYAFASSAPA